MGFSSRGVTSAEIQAAILDDATRFSGADITTIEARKGSMMQFYSAPSALQVTISSTATTKALPSITLPNLTGVTVTAAYAMIYINTLLDNSGSQNEFIPAKIQADTGSAGWIDAIEFNTGDGTTPANGYKWNLKLFGRYDIAAKVAFNQTTDFQWLNADADADNILCKRIRMGLLVIVE